MGPNGEHWEPEVLRSSAPSCEGYREHRDTQGSERRAGGISAGIYRPWAGVEDQRKTPGGCTCCRWHPNPQTGIVTVLSCVPPCRALHRPLKPPVCSTAALRLPGVCSDPAESQEPRLCWFRGSLSLGLPQQRWVRHSEEGASTSPPKTTAEISALALN